MMLHVPQVLSPAEVSDLRRALDGADWVSGQTTVGAQGAKVKNNRQLPEHSPLARELGERVLAAVRRSPLFFSAALPLRFVPPLFNRYEAGETYGLHVDGAVRPQPGTADQIRTDLSCTLFLTDPDGYDGGELEVVDTYGVHEVKLPAGDLILYPSSSIHRVTPVTRGERVASFFWIQSYVRSAERRALLFDMDMAIQRLAQSAGQADPSIIALTGSYHNLLRMWADA